GGRATRQLLRRAGRRPAQSGEDGTSGRGRDGERIRRRDRASRHAVGDPMKIGDLELVPLLDGEFRLKPTDGYPGTDWTPHRRWLTHDGMLELAIGCFLIRTNGRNVLVDAGLGTIKAPGFTGGRL